MTTFKLDWEGDQVRDLVSEATRRAIDQTTASAVAPAKSNHGGWKNRSGRAEGSIQFRPAVRRGSRWVGLFGSFNVNYFFRLELRFHTLRRAADQEFPKLAGRIKRNLRGGGR